MQKKIEFKDLNLAGRNAVAMAQTAVVATLSEWGFDCGVSPFTDPQKSAGDALAQALVDFLVSTNQPSQARPLTIGVSINAGGDNGRA